MSDLDQGTSGAPEQRSGHPVTMDAVDAINFLASCAMREPLNVPEIATHNRRVMNAARLAIISLSTDVKHEREI